MLSPQLRRKVNSLWSMFWSSGISNPLTAIEQITYLLFLKFLEEWDNARVQKGESSIYGQGNEYDLCRWSKIRLDPTFELFNEKVFPWLRNLDTNLLMAAANDGLHIQNHSQRILEDAYFQFPQDKAASLRSAVEAINELFPALDLHHSDLLGDIFEHLLSEIQTSGKNGQFRTPRHVIRLMVELVDPKVLPDGSVERVIDPAAGTGGFLFATIQHLLQKDTPPESLRLEWDGSPHRLGSYREQAILKGENFIGYDFDRTMVRVGWMNLILHGIPNPHMDRRDSLGKGLSDDESEKYDLVLANPPFTGNVDTSDLHERRFMRGGRKSKPFTNKSELLFLALALDLLKVGGRAAIIVPEGVLFGSTTAHRELRRQLLFEHDLHAVISLPGGVFQPYTGVKTSILVFHKRRANDGPKSKPGDAPFTERVWFYEVVADGYTLDAKRNAKPAPNDLWDAAHKKAAWDAALIANTSDRDIATDDKYYQAHLFEQRWRLVDEATTKIFPDLIQDVGRAWGVHELFPELDTFLRSDGSLDTDGLRRATFEAQHVTPRGIVIQAASAR